MAFRVIEFNTNGNEKQKEVARLWAECPEVIDLLYGGSKGSGKSYLGCALLTSDAVTYPGTFYFVARKVQSDLVKYTLPSFYEVFEAFGLTENYYTYNNKYNYFEFYNKSRIYLIDARYMPTDPDYTRFGSMQMTRGWIEEAGEFNPAAKANLQATIGRMKNSEYGLSPKLLLTCNPSNNFLYMDYYKPWKEGKLPSWRKFVQALPQDNKKLPPDYVSNLLRILTTSQIARLVYGQWEYDDDPNLLVDYDAICDVFTNDFVRESESPLQKYISTDLAGKGRDKWVAGSWKGLVVRIPIVKGFSSGKEMEEKLKKLAEVTGTPRSHIVSDADGLGFYLESYMSGIVEFKGGARAINDALYANLKSECAFKLAELIMKRKIRIICSAEVAELIKTELAMLRSKDTNTAENKRAIISKDLMKQLIGRSPDFLDMLIMRMIFEIKPEAKGTSTTSSEAFKTAKR